MSHFYGTLQGTRGRATRCGTKSSGITTQAASWAGAIETRIYFDEATGKDMYTIEMIQWKGRGDRLLIASGEVGNMNKLEIKSAAVAAGRLIAS